MEIIHSTALLRERLQKEKQHHRSIGFVPTMGALHQGHISLVEACVQENDLCVASIFVNPTQFNDLHDLETYPRTLEADCALLEKAGCAFVFAPSVDEMYPVPDTRTFDLGDVAGVMEGAHRPGHFNGVAQIVTKLFDIVAPDNAYFGEKDYQQVAVIRYLVRQLNIPVRICACPTRREADGLAMSSRNSRLSPAERRIAPCIARTLQESAALAPRPAVSEVIEHVVRTINSQDGMRVEYYQIVNSDTLQPVSQWPAADGVVGCIAVFCGDVRLIDNIRYLPCK
jgi:pantoate--beta-alanine ligase